MSFVNNSFKQVTLDDSFLSLSKRNKKIVLKSWAKPFADIIFPAINEDRFSVLYSSNAASRPNSPTNVTIGAMIIKELFGITDEDMVESLCCDIRFQYALNTTSFQEQPLSDRTFSRLRERCYLHEMETGEDLIKQEILSLADTISKFMEINPSMKRMDSIMIASNCRKMTRLEVLYTTLAKMVQAVHRTGEDAFLSGLEHYLNEDDRNRVIYHNKSEETDTKIQQIINEAASLIKKCGEAYFELPEYQLLRRMLDDQSHKNEDGTRTAKKNSEISPRSLQNPSDPDATYREKAGKDNTGYVGNFVETFDTNGAVITDYSYKPNSHSDSSFCKETLEAMGKQETPITLIVDGAYSGTDNQEIAEENNIRLVVTDLTGRKPEPIFAGFILSEDGQRVENCPAGNEPMKNTYNAGNGVIRVVMELEACEQCPHRDECKVKLQKKSAVVNVTGKKVERAKQYKKMHEDEYRELSRKRNGVEGIPSVLRRKYDVDHIPVRGTLHSKLFFGFKIGAINVKKLLKHMKQRVNSAQNEVFA